MTALINIGNGNPYQEFEVSALTDEQVASALEEAALVPDIADMAEGDNDREWLADFCEKHMNEYGEVFTLP